MIKQKRNSFIHTSVRFSSKLTQVLSAMSSVLLSMSASEKLSASEEEEVSSCEGADLLSFVVTGAGRSGGESMKGWTGRRRFRMEIRVCGRLNSPSRIKDGR